MKRVLILQEYVPSYRQMFFDRLAERGLAAQLEIVVGSGAPSAELMVRNDRGGLQVARHVYIDQREFRFLNRRVVHRNARTLERNSDFIILEQARRNLDVYKLLLPRRSSKAPIALWGHGRDYTNQNTKLERWIQRILTRRAAWFFAYTSGGKEAAQLAGISPHRVTVVQNTTDVEALRNDIARIGLSDSHLLRERYAAKGPIAVHLGALDESKRIEFLIEAVQKVRKRIPNLTFIFAGDGEMRPRVDEFARSRDWVHILGNVEGKSKAAVLCAADVLCLPGRVGLVAVDSLAAGVPIITTNWPWHAPEFEYLENDTNAVVSGDSVEEYVEAVVITLKSKDKLRQLSAAASSAGENFSVDKMAELFLSGILEAMQLSPND